MLSFAHARVLHSYDDQDLRRSFIKRQSSRPSRSQDCSNSKAASLVSYCRYLYQHTSHASEGVGCTESACLKGPPSQRSLQRSATALCGKRATRISQPVRGIEHAARTRDAANSAHLTARGAA